jgi:hypothetical protein
MNNMTDFDKSKTEVLTRPSAMDLYSHSSEHEFLGENHKQLTAAKTSEKSEPRAKWMTMHTASIYP